MAEQDKSENGPRNLEEMLFLTNPLRQSDRLTLDDFRQSQRDAEAEKRMHTAVLAQVQVDIVAMLCQWASDGANTGVAFPDPIVVKVLHSMVHDWLDAAVSAGDDRARVLTALVDGIGSEADSEGSQG